MEQLSGYTYAAQSRNPFSYSKVEQISRDASTAWLTLDEITSQLNIYGDESQDNYLSGLELAVRFAIEDYLGMSIFPVKYRVWYGPEGMVASPASLDLPAVSQSLNSSGVGLTINSVGFWNSGNTFVAITDYYYDQSGNKVIVNSLPTDINSNRTAPIVVEYTTDGNPLQNYPVIKQAALLLLTHLYDNRSNTTEKQMKEIPFGVDCLLRPYKPLVM